MDVDATWTPLTAEFDYRWKLIKDGQFHCEPEVKDTTKWCISQCLFVNGKAAYLVWELKGSIKKDNLTFTTKFLWLLVRHCLSPTVADNIVTYDRAVLMDAMIAGFEVDFAWLLQAVIHKRNFKATTTYSFPCMVFALWRSVGVPVWHIEVINSLLRQVDIGLIWDKANELAPDRRPCIKVQSLGENLAATVEKAYI